MLINNDRNPYRSPTYAVMQARPQSVMQARPQSRPQSPTYAVMQARPQSL
jgi:hypothetical protein